MGSMADEPAMPWFDPSSEPWNERRWDVAEELFEPDWDNGPQLPLGPNRGTRMARVDCRDVSRSALRTHSDRLRRQRPGGIAGRRPVLMWVGLDQLVPQAK